MDVKAQAFETASHRHLLAAALDGTADWARYAPGEPLRAALADVAAAKRMSKRLMHCGLLMLLQATVIGPMMITLTAAAPAETASSFAHLTSERLLMPAAGASALLLATAMLSLRSPRVAGLIATLGLLLMFAGPALDDQPMPFVAVVGPTAVLLTIAWSLLDGLLTKLR